MYLCFFGLCVFVSFIGVYFWFAYVCVIGLFIFSLFVYVHVLIGILGFSLCFSVLR